MLSKVSITVDAELYVKTPNVNSFIKQKIGDFNEFFLKISDFKKYKLTSDNFVQIIFDEFGKDYVFCDDEFNYESGE